MTTQLSYRPLRLSDEAKDARLWAFDGALDMPEHLRVSAAPCEDVFDGRITGILLQVRDARKGSHSNWPVVMSDLVDPDQEAINRSLALAKEMSEACDKSAGLRAGWLRRNISERTSRFADRYLRTPWVDRSK